MESSARAAPFLSVSLARNYCAPDDATLTRLIDLPSGIAEERHVFAKRQYEELTGLEWDAPVSQYIRACKFHISPHDLCLMRELFGLPRRVISAIPNARGNFVTVLFQ